MSNTAPQMNIDMQSKPLQSHQSFTTPVTFIWYGPEVPEDYMIKLSTLPYPVKFFKNPPIARTFNRQLKLIQKADYYRLEYVYEHGGIYSDFDNQIDYYCVRQVLSKYKDSDKVIFWWQPKRNAETRNVVPNSFIYAPAPHMPAMSKILQLIDQTNTDLKFAGMEYLVQFANKQLIQVKELYDCIKHEYDFSWVKESGKAEGERKQKEQLVNKKRKKADVVQELEMAKKQNTFLKREYEILTDKYKESEEKLMTEYKSRYVQSRSEGSAVIVNAQSVNIDDKLVRNAYLEGSTTKEQTPKQGAPQFKHGQIRAPPGLYPAEVQPVPQQYSGPSMKSVNVLDEPKVVQSNKPSEQYAMDQLIVGFVAGSVISLMIILILWFIWVQYQKINRSMENGELDKVMFMKLKREKMKRNSQDTNQEIQTLNHSESQGNN